MNTFDVRSYGATGNKSESATKSIQKAIDSCAAAGGGMVYVPPGEYTVATLRLRSNIRFFIEAGATLFSSKDRAEWGGDNVAVFHGEDLEHVTLEGRGVVDGCAEYEWREAEHDDRFIKENLDEFLKTGKKPLRAYPKKNSVGGIVKLLRCTDVRITGLSFLHARGCNIYPYACRGLVIDGVQIFDSLSEGVWADGIDPDGCSDVRICNSTIETGDDALVFFSIEHEGPALPCENITVTNCRLSSASSAIKFADGIKDCVRNVVIDNCLITNSNRGIAFMTFDGGFVSDVIISNCIIETRRFDWFWWGDGDPFYFMIRKRYSELQPELGREDRPAGAIRNVLIRDCIAHGKARCLLRGHPEQYLEGIRFDSVKLFLKADPTADYDKEGGAITLRHARDIIFKDLEVIMEEPTSKQWTSPLVIEDARDIMIQGFRGKLPASSKEPAISIGRNVEGVTIKDSRAETGTDTFVSTMEGSKNIVLIRNDLRAANRVLTGPKASVREIDSII